MCHWIFSFKVTWSYKVLTFFFFWEKLQSVDWLIWFVYLNKFACFCSQARRKTFWHGICGSSSSSASIEYFTFFENVGAYSSGRRVVNVSFFSFKFLQCILLTSFFPLIIAEYGKRSSCECFRKPSVVTIIPGWFVVHKPCCISW